MNEVTPEIAEDIQILANYFLEAGEYLMDDGEYKAAERVEAYLSSFKPDHL